jgi:diacylglycerol kinase (CTP)
VYLYISEGDVKIIVLVLWTALAVIVPADILRLRYPRFERIYERFLGFLMRESEKVRFSFPSYFIYISHT